MSILAPSRLHEFALLLACTAVPLTIALLLHRAPLRTWLLSPLTAVLVTTLGAIVWPLLRSHTLPPNANPTILYFSGLLFFIGLGVLAGVATTRRRPDTLIKRGTLITDGRAPRRLGRRRSGVTLAGIPIDDTDEPKHFKLIGTTGTGKSTAIRELLAGALKRGDRVVIADPDGAYTQRFYDANAGDRILNPFDARSHRWDLFNEIRQPYDVEQLARALIPDSDGEERAWRAYARTFFTAVTRQLWEWGLRQPRYHDLGELYRLLTMATSDELKVLVQGTTAQPFLEGGNERMFGSIRSVTANQIAALDFITAQNAEPLSIREWTRAADAHLVDTTTSSRPYVLHRQTIRSEDPAPRDRKTPAVSSGFIDRSTPTRALFLPYSATQIAALKSLLSAWLRLAIFETMNGPEQSATGQRLWFIIDELDALGTIDGLKDALARLRKFGGRCVLGFQSIAQVRDTYGDAQAQTIVENCGTTLILRCSASEKGGTAQFASRLIGQREVVRQQTSSSHSRQGWAGHVRHSRTTSQHHLTEDAVLPSQIEQLPDLAGYLKLASSPEWHRVRLRLSE